MLVKRSSFDLQGLLACARGELFGPGNPQLPLPPMLMFDRITKITEDGGSSGKGEIEAELDVKCHFLGDPVMPGVWASTRCGRWWAFSWAGWADLDAAGHWAWAR